MPPPRPLRQRVGQAGEAAALGHLRRHGYTILATDWRCPLGQIDIVAETAGTLVVIEVKARRSMAFGPPQEAVDRRKQRKLRLLLESYRSATGRQHQPCRIDVIAVRLDAQLAVRACDHIPNAVSG
ncbi:MAG: YraN family protein [Candidatus Dormibacteria bacterium]